MLPNAAGTPTAVQSVAVGHETLLNIGEPDAGLGVVWIAHFAPFQRSARVLLGKEFVVEYPPTAVHALPALHETEVSPASVVPAGSGVVWMAQLVPFHRSASTLSGKKFELVLV